MKFNELNFIKYILLASIIILIIAFFPVYSYASKYHIYSFIIGYIISFLNVTIGFVLNEKALSKSMKNFMMMVFGGMTLRLILVVIILVILLTYTNLESISLVSSVFFFYFVFISIEIYFLLKKSHKNKLNSNSSNIF